MTSQQKTKPTTKKLAFVIQGTPAVLKKLINKETLLLAVTIGINAAISAIAAPSPQELNLTPRPIISNRVERTIVSVACEAASNGLPRKDSHINVWAEVVRNGRRYDIAEIKAMTTAILDQAESCRHDRPQLTANRGAK
jgi:hypothetical protein